MSEGTPHPDISPLSKWGRTLHSFTHSLFHGFLMQMPVARMRLQYRRRYRWLFDRGTVFPVFIEHLVDDRRHLIDPAFLEVRRQQRGEIFFNALAADFVDRLGARSDENLLEFFLAVIVITRHRNFGRVFRERAERLKCILQARMEAAADLAGPAHVEGLLL